jgi:hypothetical protein
MVGWWVGLGGKRYRGSVSLPIILGFMSQQELNQLLTFVSFRDAQVVQKACKGLGTADELLIAGTFLAP